MNKTLADRKVKICLISISLAKGGLERSVALLTKMLENEGFQVHLVLLNNDIDYEYAGQLYNMDGQKQGKDSIFKRFKRFQNLKNYLEQHKFAYIIDTRAKNSAFKELYYLNYIYRHLKVIYLVSSFKLESYFPNSKWVVKRMINKATKIVCVSKAIQEKIAFTYNTEKAITIYNPIEDLGKVGSSTKDSEKYILFLGRLDDEVKNITLLLEAYQLSVLPKHNVHLKILGDGPDKLLVQNKIKSLNLEAYVDMISFTSEIYPYVSQAHFLTLTSKHEGFPRVLIEALSVGTPVISVNCQSGPSEIIEHNKNGLLVENHNPKALAAAFDSYILDQELYDICKANSKASVSHLNPDIIAKQWSKILQNG